MREEMIVDPVLEDLIFDLLEWIALRERTYEEVMNAWRTSCSKLPVWEEANDRKLVAIEDRSGCSTVSLTTEGLVFVERHNPRA